MTLAAINPVLSVLSYVAAMLAGFGVGVAVNAVADTVVGDETPPWQAGTCRKCGAPLPIARLAPVLGLSAARRTCVSCGQQASLRRPLLEISLALMFPLLLAHALTPQSAGHLAPWGVFLIEAAGCGVLAFIFAVDLEHRLILDLAIYPTAAALVLIALIFDHKALASMLFGVIVCGGLFVLLYYLGRLIYHEEPLGFGDVKLAVLIGLLVGWPAVMTALVLGALLGAGVSVLLLGLGTATRHSYIPFGIFLAFGAALALLLAAPLW